MTILLSECLIFEDFRKLGSLMKLKLVFLHAHLRVYTFLENHDDCSEKQGERFQQDIKGRRWKCDWMLKRGSLKKIENVIMYCVIKVMGLQVYRVLELRVNEELGLRGNGGKSLWTCSFGTSGLRFLNDPKTCVASMI